MHDRYDPRRCPPPEAVDPRPIMATAANRPPDLTGLAGDGLGAMRAAHEKAMRLVDLLAPAARECPPKNCEAAPMPAMLADRLLETARSGHEVDRLLGIALERIG